MFVHIFLTLQIINLINQGENNRHFSQTVLNHCSSRSHTLFRIYVEAYTKDPKTESIKLFTIQETFA
jgi:hypothetical protein